MLRLGKAKATDLDAVFSLYTSAIGQPGCVWGEGYPTREDAEGDLLSGGLYVLREDGKIVGAVSVLSENELDDLSFWSESDLAYAEIARVVIARSRQGRGYARLMLSRLFSSLVRRGYGSIRLLVARENPAAIKTYKALGFSFSGECFMFSNHYLACEKFLVRR